MSQVNGRKQLVAKKQQKIQTKNPKMLYSYTYGQITESALIPYPSSPKTSDYWNHNNFFLETKQPLRTRKCSQCSPGSQLHTDFHHTLMCYVPLSEKKHRYSHSEWRLHMCTTYSILMTLRCSKHWATWTEMVNERLHMCTIC